MKKLNSTTTYFSSVFLLLFCLSLNAQVGIGNLDPKTQLDVDGALSLREGTALALNNGLNSNLNLGTTPYSSYRITGPTADFSIRSITPVTNADGQIVTLINTTTQDLTIVNDSGSVTSRIYNPGGVDILITGQYSTVTLQYNTSVDKWFLISFQNGNLISDDWTTSGNAGTTAGTNFLGTTDGNALSFFTNNTEKLRISIGGHFRSFTDGTTTLPMFSWDTDRDTGFYRIGADILGFTTGGSESIRISTTESVVNDDSDDYNFRVESNGVDDMLFVDGGQNAVGIATDTPQTALHVAGASNIVRVESLNSTNNANNNGLTPSIVKANANGDLILTNDNPIDAVTLATDYSLTGTGAFSDVPAMSLTFVARKSTVMVTLTGSGDANAQLAAGIGDFLVYNVTTSSIFAGTHQNLTTFDDVFGVLGSAWNIGFSKPLTGLTVGNTYTLKVQAFFDPILTYTGSPAALVINSATEPFHHHLTLSVAQ